MLHSVYRIPWPSESRTYFCLRCITCSLYHLLSGAILWTYFLSGALLWVQHHASFGLDLYTRVMGVVEVQHITAQGYA